MRRGILVAVVGLGLVSLEANAKVIFVTTTADVIDGPACSLRDAVRSANTDTPKGGCLSGLGDDEIVLPAGTYRISRAGAGEDAAATGDYDVLGSGGLTVYGDANGGTVIDAAGIDRAFHAHGAVPLTLIDLAITGGNPGHGDTWPLDGGAIMANALTLERVVLEGNRTATGDEIGIPPYPDPGGSGGAVAVSGTLVVRDSVFRDNHTGGGGNATGATGGGNGGAGGAIVLFGSTATIERTRFEGNSTGRGGAQSNVAGSYVGRGGAGGALSLNRPATLRNVVITDNVTGGRGTGADQSGYTPPGALSIGETVVSLFNVTLARNAADPGVPTALGTTPMNGTINVTASIVDGSCGGGSPIVDGGDNLTAAGSGCPGTVGDADVDVDAIPAADSPAIDAMTTACPAVDARGIGRPQGAACDIGAIERGPSTLIVTPSSLTFPDVALGTSSGPLPVTVDYAGDGSFALRDTTTSGDFQATGCADALRMAGTCVVDVFFVPTATGARSGTLTLATPLGPRTVALSGTGLAGGGPGGCGPRVATLGSVGCRLRVLADDVNGASNLGNSQKRLTELLGKARSKHAAAETFVAGPNPKKGRRALKVVVSKLKAFSRTLRSRSARRTLDAEVRTLLIARADELAGDVRALVKTIE